MIPNHSPNRLLWKFGDQSWSLAGEARIMGIVNVTPDSFSDGGQWHDPNSAIDHALRLVSEGADMLDIGGESTRPGAEEVSITKELARVIPVIEGLQGKTNVPISIDTTKSQVAQEALSAGAQVVNDISGLTFDSKMISVCAKSNCGVIAMHIKGTPQTMQDNPRYENVVAEVRSFLDERLSALTSAGISPERIMLDPGIGFGKTAEHNLQLMQQLPTLRSLERPLLVGHSRKRFLGKLLGREVEERTAGTIGVSLALRMLGADLIRVHDVRSVRDALTAFRTLLNTDNSD